MNTELIIVIVVAIGLLVIKNCLFGEKESEFNMKAARDNRANQLNPNNKAYWSSRGKSKPT